MPKFSKISAKRLSECHPDLQVLCNEMIQTFDFSVLCGFRNEADQNKCFAEKTSKLKWPKSKHNQIPSMAVDLSPWPIDWENIERFELFREFVINYADRLYAEGKMKHKITVIEWDLPHFQLVS